MNWPEHLRVLHRLTGRDGFNFSHAEGTIELQYLPNAPANAFPWRMFWSSGQGGGISDYNDTNIQMYLRQSRNLVLESVVG